MTPIVAGDRKAAISKTTSTRTQRALSRLTLPRSWKRGVLTISAAALFAIGLSGVGAQASVQSLNPSVNIVGQDTLPSTTWPLPGPDQGVSVSTQNLSYQPGDSVVYTVRMELEGPVALINNAAFRTSQTFTMTLVGPSGQTVAVDTQPFAMNDGRLSLGVLTLPKDAEAGTYSLQVQSDQGSAQCSFVVASSTEDGDVETLPLDTRSTLKDPAMPEQTPSTTNATEAVPQTIGWQLPEPVAPVDPQPNVLPSVGCLESGE